MDVVAYAASKKNTQTTVTNVTSGIKSYSVDGQTLNIETAAGQTLKMTFPTPADGVSVTKVEIDSENHLICTFSDKTTYDAGYIKTVRGIQGPPGPKGEDGKQGEPFSIAHVYNSVAAMQNDFRNSSIKTGSMIMISTEDIDDEDNAKIYVKTKDEWVFITDLSGATGIQGERGPQGESIQEVKVIDNVLYCTLTDGTTLEAGRVDESMSQEEIEELVKNVNNLTNYYTKTETDKQIKEVEVLDNFYDKDATDKQIKEVAELDNFYDKTEIDAAIADFITKAVADLENYYTKTEVESKIAEIKITSSVVEELPETGTKNVLYLMAKDEEEKDVYNEYIWVDGKYELIGSTRVDISNCATKDELQTAIDNFNSALGEAVETINGTIDSVKEELEGAIEEVQKDIEENISKQIEDIQKDIQDLNDNKQNNLTAGDHITIEDDTISADMYDDTEVRELIDALDKRVEIGQDTDDFNIVTKEKIQINGTQTVATLDDIEELAAVKFQDVALEDAEPLTLYVYGEDAKYTITNKTWTYLNTDCRVVKHILTPEETIHFNGEDIEFDVPSRLTNIEFELYVNGLRNFEGEDYYVNRTVVPNTITFDTIYDDFDSCTLTYYSNATVRKVEILENNVAQRFYDTFFEKFPGQTLTFDDIDLLDAYIPLGNYEGAESDTLHINTYVYGHEDKDIMIGDDSKLVTKIWLIQDGIIYLSIPFACAICAIREQSEFRIGDNTYIIINRSPINKDLRIKSFELLNPTPDSTLVYEDNTLHFSTDDVDCGIGIILEDDEGNEFTSPTDVIFRINRDNGNMGVQAPRTEDGKVVSYARFPFIDYNAQRTMTKTLRNILYVMDEGSVEIDMSCGYTAVL